MLKELAKKFVSFMIVFLFGFVIYREFVAPSENPDGSLAASSLSLSESQTMYQALGGPAGGLPVTVFVTDWCSICKSLEAKLTESGLPFARANIDNSRDAKLYYQRVTRGVTGGVPVTVVGQQVFVGYNLQGIAEALAELNRQLSGPQTEAV